MSKNPFHTRFNPAKRLTTGKVYDSRDEVDRLSYVDSTAMITRLINEGKNLAAYRADALRSGQYSGDFNEIVHDNGIPLPVYQSDPVVVAPVLDAAFSALNKSKSENLSANSDSDKGVQNSDLDKADNKAVSESATSAASV